VREWMCACVCVHVHAYVKVRACITVCVRVFGWVTEMSRHIIVFGNSEIRHSAMLTSHTMVIPDNMYIWDSMLIITWKTMSWWYDESMPICHSMLMRVKMYIWNSVVTGHYMLICDTMLTSHIMVILDNMYIWDSRLDNPFWVDVISAWNDFVKSYVTNLSRTTV
jgi:hypothetical protein